MLACVSHPRLIARMEGMRVPRSLGDVFCTPLRDLCGFYGVTRVHSTGLPAGMKAEAVTYTCFLKLQCCPGFKLFSSTGPAMSQPPAWWHTPRCAPLLS